MEIDGTASLRLSQFIESKLKENGVSKIAVLPDSGFANWINKNNTDSSFDVFVIDFSFKEQTTGKPWLCLLPEDLDLLLLLGPIYDFNRFIECVLIFASGSNVIHVVDKLNQPATELDVSYGLSFICEWENEDCIFKSTEKTSERNLEVDEEQLLATAREEIANSIPLLTKEYKSQSSYKEVLESLLYGDRGYLNKFSKIIASRIFFSNPKSKWVHHYFGYESLNSEIRTITPEKMITGFKHNSNSAELKFETQTDYWINFLLNIPHDVPTGVRPPSIHAWLMACENATDLDKDIHSLTLYLYSDESVKSLVQSFNQVSPSNLYLCLSAFDKSNEGEKWGWEVWLYLSKISGELNGPSPDSQEQKIISVLRGPIGNLMPDQTTKGIETLRDPAYELSQKEQNVVLQVLKYSAFLWGVMAGGKDDVPDWLNWLRDKLKDDDLRRLEVAIKSSRDIEGEYFNVGALRWDAPPQLLSEKDRPLGSSLTISETVLNPVKWTSFGVDQLYSTVRTAEHLAKHEVHEQLVGMNNAQHVFDHDFLKVAAKILPSINANGAQSGFYRKINEIFDVTMLPGRNRTKPQLICGDEIKSRDFGRLNVHMMPIAVSWLGDLFSAWEGSTRYNVDAKNEGVLSVYDLISRAVERGIRGGLLRHKAKNIDTHSSQTNLLYFKGQEKLLKSRFKMAKDKIALETPTLKNWHCAANKKWGLLEKLIIAAVSNTVYHGFRQPKRDLDFLRMNLSVESTRYLIITIYNYGYNKTVDRGRGTYKVISDLSPMIGGRSEKLRLEYKGEKTWITSFDIDLSLIAIKM